MVGFNTNEQIRKYSTVEWTVSRLLSGTLQLRSRSCANPNTKQILSPPLEDSESMSNETATPYSGTAVL
jgi:hypothetical protein